MAEQIIQDTWTVAYRKPRANRFLRIDGLALTWTEAEKLARRVAEALGEGYEVYYVPTLQSEEDGLVHAEDVANILVPSGRRVRILEGGKLPESLRAVPATPKLTDAQWFVYDALKRHHRFHPGCGWIYGNYSSTVRVLDALVRKGLASTEEKTESRTGDPYTEYRPIFV